MRTLFLPLLTALVMTGCNSHTSARTDVVSERYIHKYGVAVSKEEWRERGRSGRVIETKQDGRVTTSSYEGGILEGDRTITFPHSRTIETLQTYHEGNLTREVTHYASGMPRIEERFTTDQGRVLTEWYEGGTPKMVETYQGEFLIKGEYYGENSEIETRVANGKGTRTMRDSYGQLLSRDTFLNGQLTTVTTYHQNGTPKGVTPYVNHRVHGSKKTFLASGQPNTIESWVDGVQEGTTTTFRNGEKHAEVPYIGGKPHGTERRFEGEEVVEELTWVAGRQHGPAISKVNGQDHTTWFYNGKLVSKMVYDGLKGKIR